MSQQDILMESTLQLQKPLHYELTKYDHL